MADKFFDDYLTGLNTGVAFNGASELGAQHAYRPPPPPPPLAPPSVAAPSAVAHAGAAAVPAAWSGVAAPAARRPASFLDKWVWGLAGTLTHRFDAAADRLIGTTTWRLLLLLTAALGVLVSWGLGLADPEAHGVLFGAVTAAGLAIGAAAPFLVLLLVRMALWLAGVVVQLLAALVLVGVILGVAAGIGYAVILALA